MSDEPIVKNAADEGQLSEAKDKVKINRTMELNALRSAMQSKAFRKWMYQTVNLCDRISADASGSWTYFREGERNVALKMKSDIIEADPQSYLLMMKEQKEK